MDMRREDFIPAAEVFANSLHADKLGTMGGRGKWNRAFHYAMAALVDGRAPRADEVSYEDLWTWRMGAQKAAA